jgi:ipoprotein LpqH
VFNGSPRTAHVDYLLVGNTGSHRSIRLATGQRPPAIGDATRGIGAVLSTTAPPEVMSITLGNVSGVTLGYPPAEGVNWDPAQATKDGNTYKITGTAMGIDTANPTQPVHDTFEINVTCP